MSLASAIRRGRGDLRGRRRQAMIKVVRVALKVTGRDG
jgi:hypothetical protein